jgi:hypothetical protein
MYPALILPLLIAAAPGQPVAAATDDPPIQIWINNDRRFFPGDRGKVQVRSEDDGYLIVLHADPDGNLRVLFPLDPNDDNFVRGGKKYEIRGRGDRESFDVDTRTGHGTIYAAVSKSAYRFDDFVLGDHWDYRNLAPNRLPRDPETELTDLVRRMAQGSFDYDILGYDVIERVYASSSYYDYPSYGSVYYGDSYCCSGLSLGFSFGRPYYRRPFYGYAYDPFYDPFFYDPWYYRPYYYTPAYYRPYYGYSPYGYYPYGYSPYGGYYPYGGHYYTRDRFYRDRYYPRTNPLDNYRYRGFQGINTNFRDRRYTFRSVNTVYTPPPRRFAETETASPLRRTVESRGAASPRRVETGSDAAPRRATSTEPARRAEPRRNGGSDARQAPSVDRRRLETPGTVEPRRARPVEVERNPIPDARDRRDLPVDVSPRRNSDPGDARRAGTSRDLPQDVSPRRDSDAGQARRAEPSRDQPQYEARPSRPSDDRSEPAQRAEPRGERASPPPSSGGDSEGGRRASGGDSDGGRRSAGGGWGGGGSGGGGGRSWGGDAGGGRGDGGGGRRR